MRIFEVIQSDIKPYANLNSKYPAGNTEVWFARDNMSTPDVDNLRATHVLIGKVGETDPKNIFAMMQGEVLSPQGEATEFLKRLGIARSSIRPGDVIKIGNDALIVTKDGFDNLTKEPTDVNT